MQENKGGVRGPGAIPPHEGRNYNNWPRTVAVGQDEKKPHFRGALGFNQ